MPEAAYIVDIVRTAGGRRKGALAGLHPTDLGAYSVDALVTIDRQCGSSQQALHFAAQAVMSGTQDIMIAAGIEHMTGVPIAPRATRS